MKLPSIIFLVFGLFSLSALGQTYDPLFLIKQNGRVGYIDRTGKVVIEPQFDDGWYFSEGLACVTVKGKTGFIDTSGIIVIKPQFNSLYGCYEEFREGLAPISMGSRELIKGQWVDNSKWGFVDKNGKVMILPGVSFVSKFREGLAFFHKDGLTGYFDRNLSIVIKPQFKSAGSFYESRARATDVDGTEYYIDKTGRRLFRNNDGGEVQDSAAFFEIDGKYGFIDLDGKVIVEPQFSSATHFGEGLAGVKVGDKWGFIDKKGKLIIPPTFDNVGDFSEGLVSVELKGKWGFADHDGKIVIPPQFDKWSYFFDNGLCRVHVGDQTGYIDKAGKWIWPLSN